MSFDEGRIILFQRDKVEFDSLMKAEKSLREAGIHLPESSGREKLEEMKLRLEKEAAGIYSKTVHNDFQVVVLTRYADTEQLYPDIIFKNDVRIPAVEHRGYTTDPGMKEMLLRIGCHRGTGNSGLTATKEISIDLTKCPFGSGEVKILFHYIDDLRIIVEVFLGNEYLFSEEVKLCSGKEDGDRDFRETDKDSMGAALSREKVRKFPVSDLNQDGTLDVSHLVNDKLFLLGISFIKNRKYNNARDCLQDLQDKGFYKAKELLKYLNEQVFNDDIDAMTELAESYIEKDDAYSLREAESIAESLREKGYPIASFLQGECHISKNSDSYDTDEALRCFRQFIYDSAGNERDERYVIAAHYCALIIFNDQSASVSLLSEALQYAQEVRESNPKDTKISGLIDNIDDRLQSLRTQEKKKKIRNIVTALILIFLVVFIGFKAGSILMGGPGSGDGNKESTEAEKSYTISVDNANIRSGPGTEYEVVSSGEMGDTFAATGKVESSSDGEWYEIYIDGGKSSKGWVSAKVASS